MKQFENILFVPDEACGDEEALARAVALSRESGARLTAALAWKPPRWGGRDVHERLEAELRARLERLAASVEGSPVRTALLPGPKPFVEIVRRVLAEEHDLLVKPAEVVPGALHRHLSSSDMHLLRKCPCAVLLLEPHRRDRFASILAAVDTDPYGPDDELNARILETGVSFARREEARLHVVHAWRLEGESALRGGLSRLPNARVDEMLRGKRRRHEEALLRLTERYPLDELGARVHLEEGLPEDVIASVASSQRCDLIVMGTVGRSGISGVIIGNTAENVLPHVSSSVLAIKPAGFETPIRLEE